ncbi:MAG: redoxin domain-containing protein [Pirellula sp.]
MRLVNSIFMMAMMFVSTTFAADGLKVGDSAPEFELKGSDGKTYAAKDFVGKQAVIIAWFPRAFTGGCTKECNSMRESGAQLREYQVAYFTASTDPVEKNADFAKSLNLDYPILCDPEGKNAKMFGVLKPDGKAANRVTIIIGKDGKILAIDDMVKTETHGKDLSEQLAKLGVAKRAAK